MGSGRVLGVDACKRGWIAIEVEDAIAHAYFAEEIQTLMGRAEADGPLAVVAIDMPIGLPDRGRRQADLLARAAVGPLWPSVFMTPVREALLAADHATQAFGLRSKLFQVEQWIRQTPVHVVEIHPEVCFARLAGGPLTTRKSSWAGAELRRATWRCGHKTCRRPRRCWRIRRSRRCPRCRRRRLDGATGSIWRRSASPQPARNLQRRLGMRDLVVTDLLAA